MFKKEIHKDRRAINDEDFLMPFQEIDISRVGISGTSDPSEEEKYRAEKSDLYAAFRKEIEAGANRITLRNKQLDDEDAEYLAELLTENRRHSGNKTSAQEIDLSNNNIGKKGALALLGILKGQIKRYDNEQMEEFFKSKNGHKSSFLYNSEIESFVQSGWMERNDSLKKANLENNPYFPSAIKQEIYSLLFGRRISEAIEKGVATMNLSQSDVNDDDVALLSKKLKGNATVQKIDLSGNCIGEKGGQELLSLLNHNDTLKAISLKDNVVVKGTGDALKKETITEIHLVLAGRAIEAGTTAIDFCDYDDDDDACLAIIGMLKGNNTVSALRIGNHCPPQLIGLLEENSAIRSVKPPIESDKWDSCRWNNLDLDNYNKLRGLSRINELFYQKAEINIGETNSGSYFFFKKIASLIKDNTTAITLSMPYCNDDITQALAHNYILEKLKIYCFRNTEESETYRCFLARNAALKKIQSGDALVDMSSLRLTDADAGKIAQTIKESKTLRQLNLSNNWFGKEGGEALLKAAQENAEFRVLFIDNNPGISEETRRAVVKGWGIADTSLEDTQHASLQKLLEVFDKKIDADLTEYQKETKRMINSVKEETQQATDSLDVRLNDQEKTTKKITSQQESVRQRQEQADEIVSSLEKTVKEEIKQAFQQVNETKQSAEKKLESLQKTIEEEILIRLGDLVSQQALAAERQSVMDGMLASFQKTAEKEISEEKAKRLREIADGLSSETVVSITRHSDTIREICRESRESGFRKSRISVLRELCPTEETQEEADKLYDFLFGGLIASYEMAPMIAGGTLLKHDRKSDEATAVSAVCRFLGKAIPTIGANAVFSGMSVLAQHYDHLRQGKKIADNFYKLGNVPNFPGETPSWRSREEKLKCVERIFETAAYAVVRYVIEEKILTGKKVDAHEKNRTYLNKAADAIVEGDIDVSTSIQKTEEDLVTEMLTRAFGLGKEGNRARYKAQSLLYGNGEVKNENPASSVSFLKTPLQAISRHIQVGNIESLQSQINGLGETILQMQKAIAELQTTDAARQKEMETLRDENATKQQRIEELQKADLKRQSEVDALKKKVTEQEKIIGKPHDESSVSVDVGSGFAQIYLTRKQSAEISRSDVNESRITNIEDSLALFGSQIGEIKDEIRQSGGVSDSSNLAERQAHETNMAKLKNKDRNQNLSSFSLC